MDKQHELRQLVKIASLYYEQDMNQSDIARRMLLSQSYVSRALKRCQREGIVRFSIAHPTGTHVSLENELQERYGVKQIIVVDVDDDASERTIRQAIGSAAAVFLENSLKGDELVGISSWSSLISAMVDLIHPNTARARGVIQLLGGVGHNQNLQANIVTNELARLLGCAAYLLPTKAFGRSAEHKQSQLDNEELAEVVRLFPEVDVALVGIGTSTPSELVLKAGIFAADEMGSDLAARGAVGDICLHYYDREGRSVLREEEDPVISMSLEQIRECSLVVGLAGGLHKVDAIRGAFAGDYLDMLITDCTTARALAASP